jgi:hypothetical protein
LKIKHTYLSKKRLICLFLICLLSFALLPYPCSSKLPKDIIWAVTIEFSSLTNDIDIVIFGESPNAHDGPPIDFDYDLSHPPPPPYNFTYSWFDDNLPIPHNKLRGDFRSFPGHKKTWNLSVFWFNLDYHQTIITMRWKKNEFYHCEYNTVILYDLSKNIPLLNMRTEETYAFPLNAMEVKHFKILCGNVYPSSGPYIKESI